MITDRAKRVNRLERGIRSSSPDLSKFTDSELRFVADLQDRLIKADTIHFCDVCTSEEMKQITKLSTKLALLSYKDTICDNAQ